ncbi:MAG: hypothetical protein E7510_12330, partial [Ruminococcus sp.]|nr:hypothetical protein [Ruminococcus sp.]
MDNLGDILVPYIGSLKPSRIAREMGFMEDCVEEEIEVKASVLEEEIHNEGGTFFLDDVISFSEDGLK